MKKKRSKEPIQPVSGTKVPRFAGPSTFARLPELRDVEYCDVAIVGIPFDAGTSYRPGARFGPQSIRQEIICLCNNSEYLDIRGLLHYFFINKILTFNKLKDKFT